MKTVIIDSPHRQGMPRRIAQGVMTLGLWLAWFYLLLPAFAPALASAGVDLSAIGLPTQAVGMGLFAATVALVGLASLGFWLWGRYNARLYRRRGGRQDGQAYVGQDELAGYFRVCPRELAAWQASKQMVVHLTEKGGISCIDAKEPVIYRFSDRRARDTAAGAVKPRGESAADDAGLPAISA